MALNAYYPGFKCFDPESYLPVVLQQAKRERPRLQSAHGARVELRDLFPLSRAQS